MGPIEGSIYHKILDKNLPSGVLKMGRGGVFQLKQSNIITPSVCILLGFIIIMSILVCKKNESLITAHVTVS